MALYNDNQERTVTITLNDLGNADLMTIYRILDDLEDTNQATEVWLHAGETGEERAATSRRCGDPETARWFEGKAEEYADIFGEEEAEEDTSDLEKADEGKHDVRSLSFEEALVEVYQKDPANGNMDALLRENAKDAKVDPNNLFRAGVFEGLAEAAAWAIYSRTTLTDDIAAIKAAIYKAYGLPW